MDPNPILLDLAVLEVLKSFTRRQSRSMAYTTRNKVIYVVGMVF